MKKNKIQKINFKFIFSNQKNYFIEHKSYVEKRIFIQLLNYILSVLEDDLSNKRNLIPVIPTIFIMVKENGKFLLI